MFFGPPLPLPAELLLSQLLPHARPDGTLGVWIRGTPRNLPFYFVCGTGGSPVLVGPDLGLLLTRCARIALKEEEQMVVLEAETVIQWRALQVAMATPYLPGLERLQSLFPGLQSSETGILVPIQKQSPEEVLARCVAEGMQVTGSRVVYAGRRAGKSSSRA